MIPETTQKTIQAELVSQTFPMRRPRTLAACAAIGARRYRRQRDLPGAVPGLLAGDEAIIVPRLIAEEQRCEEARRGRTAGYRPAQHVQILSALLAEAAAACPHLVATADAPPPSEQMAAAVCGTRLPLRPATHPHPRPGRAEMPVRARAFAALAPQAKASGSEPLRSAM